ncbi:hypothetical protein EON63_12420 [archaeon]|nr:MAG: hypothetical protein EON63_12420 [archaeon]
MYICVYFIVAIHSIPYTHLVSCTSTYMQMIVQDGMVEIFRDVDGVLALDKHHVGHESYHISSYTYTHIAIACPKQLTIPYPYLDTHQTSC